MVTKTQMYLVNKLVKLSYDRHNIETRTKQAQQSSS